MKERPILFNAPMVSAILEGRKTQTRRVVKPQPPLGCEYGINGAKSHAICSAIDNPSTWVPPTPKSKDHRLPCPYGQPGDRLWVRETWGRFDERIESQRENFIYRADGETSYQRWRPSILMPRWASRITLEITDVRVERVQDITEGDAWAEGFPDPAGQNRKYEDRARYWFKNLWNDINAKRGFGWDSNPWVWAITFKKL